MNTYTQLSIASSHVCFGTIALLLWNAASSDPSYIYLSLAAPTIILAYHLLYFFNPFLDLGSSTSYTLIPSESSSASVNGLSPGPATPTSVRINRTPNERDDRPKLFIQTTSSTDSEDRNPLVSSTLSILCLILLTVLVGAIAVSSGTVAFLNAVEDASVTKAAERIDAFATIYNTTAFELESGIDLDAATVHPELTPIAAKIDDGMLAHVVDDLEAVSRARKNKVRESTVPPSHILGMQAALSLVQMVFLGSIVILAMRRRIARYAGEYDDEDDYDLRWTYVEDTAEEDAEDEDVGMPPHILEYLKEIRGTAEPIPTSQW